MKSGPLKMMLFLWIGQLFVLNSCLGSPPEADDVPVFYCQLEFPQGVITNPNTVIIPFQYVGRLLAVEATIDTISGTFLFDTGAERLLLNQDYFEGDYKDKGYMNYGSTGKQGAVWRKEVDTLSWDNLFFPNVLANVMDLSHLEEKRKIKVIGIIGYDVFKDFEILLDYPNRLIILSRTDNKGNRFDIDAFNQEIPFDSLEIEIQNHGIFVEAQVNDVKLSLNLDTGAEINLLDRRVYRKVFDNFEIKKRIMLMGAGRKKVEAIAGVLKDVKCGLQPNRSMRTLVTNLEDLRRIFAAKVDGVLGFEFLRPRRTIINYKRKKIYFLKLVTP